MYDPAFESAWLKWAGGVIECHVLADNIAEFRRLQPQPQMPLRLWVDYQPKRHCIVYTVAEVSADLFPPFWGVQLGSIVHNFRCVLDHIAWAL